MSIINEVYDCLKKENRRRKGGYTRRSTRQEDLINNILSDKFFKTCRVFGFTPDELRASKRARPLVKARQAFMYACKKECKYVAWMDLGRYLNLNHATIMHGYEKVSNALENNEKYGAEQEYVDLINRLLE